MQMHAQEQQDLFIQTGRRQEHTSCRRAHKRQQAWHPIHRASATKRHGRAPLCRHRLPGNDGCDRRCHPPPSRIQRTLGRNANAIAPSSHDSTKLMRLHPVPPRSFPSCDGSTRDYGTRIYSDRDDTSGHRHTS